MVTADIELLLKLVKRCQRASSELETAREYGDSDDRNGALNERDAAERRLGAEWEAIGEILEAVQAREKAPNSTTHTYISPGPYAPIPSKRDATGGAE